MTTADPALTDIMHKYKAILLNNKTKHKQLKSINSVGFTRFLSISKYSISLICQ